jgi:hypothetical protein
VNDIPQSFSFPASLGRRKESKFQMGASRRRDSRFAPDDRMTVKLIVFCSVMWVPEFYEVWSEVVEGGDVWKSTH